MLSFRSKTLFGNDVLKHLTFWSVVVGTELQLSGGAGADLDLEGAVLVRIPALLEDVGVVNSAVQHL